MARKRHTHGFSQLHQFLTTWIILIGGSIALTACVFTIIEPLWDSWNTALPKGARGFIEFVSGIFIWFGCVLLLLKAVVLPLSPLPSYLYLRLTLSVPASWNDARELSFLFEGIGGKWYPMDSLRNIPRELRREVLYEFADRIRAENRGIPNGDQANRVPSPPSPAPPVEDPRMSRARKILDVPAEASDETLKKAYRTLIKKYHPDVYAAAQPELKHFAAGERAKRSLRIHDQQ